ncbi:unnamed protein product [Clonostachys solani]|uniref:Uncharacterized protein n=1 Tax=Clonostachys solani TaxID=160281 RepID=A0A9N9ZEL1_9HYPO|nr:unnamed protein product [Clonostachys solani]
MSNERLDFESLKDEARGLLNEVDLLILTKFETAISSSLEPNVEEKAIRFVADLILFDAKESESFVTSTWQVLTHIASRIPSSHYGQEVLIRVVNMLEHCGPWTDLPGPTFELDAEDDREFSQAEWLNLNSFIARLFNLKGKRFGNFAIWELRNGLEEDASDAGSAAAADARVLVASEWIKRSGARLWHESVLGTFSTEPEDAAHGSPYRGGSLFHGTRGFNLERWGFWKRRLVELRNGADASVQSAIDDAVQTMSSIEKEHQLSSLLA